MAGNSNIAEYSVSEISGAIKRTMEDTFGHVRVRGELGRISRPASGHIYLDLKDANAVIAGVVWRGQAKRLKIQPEQGLEVIASGKITTFPGQSKYQLVIDTLEPAGVGALMALLEERRKKLAAEGLFDAARKRPLPGLPRVIGVVTSPSGAVIRDILHRISDRFPLHVLVWPARVQGETSGQEVANGIAGFNRLTPGGQIPRPDLIIVARGGGSLEDLWGFNDEIVVRAAAASDIPLISAVGHETDWTLIDHAADLRAPTPTGAAEFAVPVRSELLASLDDLSRRQISGLLRLIASRRTELRAAAAALPAPRDLLALPRQRFDNGGERLAPALRAGLRDHRGRYFAAAGRLSPHVLRRTLTVLGDRLAQFDRQVRRALVTGTDQRRHALTAASRGLTPDRLARTLALSRERLGGLAARAERAHGQRLATERARLDATTKLLDSLSYKNVLARGYALVRDADGQPVRSASGIAAGSALSVEFGDASRLDVMAMSGDGKSPPPRKAKPARAKASAKSTPKGQGSLF
ncbi:exodeoxyribonuclease VII large subunit [Stappia taiwanensis]|uniref:Exodeoxyribonuclease 7 large subunit n=1 Tax=Stappia taiwanensis TaxID=992267 RepID=A0A838XSR6_9HYPH|nr:exodeoxyribonuclease VII large subunit [Stappia taiwanensis]MBA4612101.1 exodeoxyribonuclease VII large subunit [Stappia taiwanensis]GGE91083.1 exodeoxyribonuclease 7 large subunit [Stappia taiwanensis]